MRNIRFLHRPETHSRRPLYDCLQKYAFPHTNKLVSFFVVVKYQSIDSIHFQPFFATVYKQTFTHDGNLFNTEKEFKRQVCSCPVSCKFQSLNFFRNSRKMFGRSQKLIKITSLPELTPHW